MHSKQILIDVFLCVRGSAWEETFLDVVGKADNDGIFKHISVARFASRSLELELEANTKTVVPYFTSSFLFMGIFSVITCMMTDWVRSKPWLGLLGNISAIAATVSAFGFCIYLGVDFIGLNLAAPFLMIGEWWIDFKSKIKSGKSAFSQKKVFDGSYNIFFTKIGLFFPISGYFRVEI